MLQTDKFGNKTLYDPKSGDPFVLKQSQDHKHYIVKGFLTERPKQKVIDKYKAEAEKKRKESIEFQVKARVKEALENLR